MACLSLAFWYDVAIYVVVLIAVVALLRLLVMALGGASGPFWPPTFNQPSGGGLLGFIAAALNIIVWAIITIFIIWLIFALIGCLLGGGPWFPRPFR